MKTLLETFCALPCVSGDEPAFRAQMRELLAPLGEVSFLPSGTVLCRLPVKKPGLPVVLLEAHLDRIGLMVARISEKGFVHASAVGGVDPRTLAAARVTIHTKAGAVAGVVCATPPHLAEKEGALPKPADVAIDVGLTAEAARERIGYGDRITLDGPFTPLLGDRVAAPAVDDCVGCAVVVRAAELLRACKTAQIVVALCAQEEVGGAGAVTAANAVSPDFCFAVDATFAETPDSDPAAVMKLGGGPAIGFAPVLDRGLCNRLVETAKEQNIPWQAEIMTRSTGTDADHIAPAGRGVRTALVSVPERYMHTAGEVVSLADAEQTALLLAKTIGGGLR